MMMTIFEAINQLTPQDLENAGMLTRAQKSGWVCPKCGNGSGKDGDGLNLIPNTNKLKCHVCGSAFSMFDAMAAYGNYDTETKAGRSATIAMAKKYFNLPTDFPTFTEKKQNATAQDVKVPQEKATDYSGSYEKWRKNLEGFIDSQGGSYRGLPLELLQKHGAGYNPANGGWLILPYDDFHYFQRAVNQNIEEPKRHRGRKGIYNVDKIRLDTPNFIVEGEIDCLSVELAGFTVIATGGSSSHNILIAELNKIYDSATRKPTFIVMFDNNDKGAGQTNAEQLVKELTAAGYPAINAILDAENQRDSNEYLQTDKRNFVERLDKILKDTEFELQQIAAKFDTEQKGLPLRNFFKFWFIQELDKAAKYSERKTGFKNLDSAQMFLPGFYVIGALSALGKTTFVWQLMSQLAARGECCIFFSYEMTQLEMFAKSLCREVYKKESQNYQRQVDKPLTSADIRRGNITDHIIQVDRAVNDFENSDDELRLINFSNETIDELLGKLKTICASTSKPVTVAIDYLQIIPHSKDNAKAGIDDIVRKLKVFQRESGITIFVISSLNRMSYEEEISFSSFKESGGIEFSADVIWGLQLYFAEKGENRKDKKLTEQKKKAIPRLIELKCLKNRNGANYSCYFKYLPMVDTFIACEEPELNADNDKFSDDEIEKD